jgi:outer membrane immunogenic protein
MPVSSFDGPYVGGSVGAEWGRSANKPVMTTGYADLDAEGERFGAGPGSYGFSDRGEARPAAYVDGGYNWRMGPLVVGLEADAGFTNATAKLRGPAPAVDPADPEAGYSVSGHANKTWGSSLRARVGFTPLSNVLLYGTGGVAIGGMRGKVTESTPNVASLLGPYGIYQTPAQGVTTNSARWSATGWGWILGAGAEAGIADHVTLHGEYLISELSGGGKDGTGVTVRNAHLMDQQMRFGLNYHF